MEWNKEIVLSFINAIKQRPAIWDTHCRDYKLKHRKNDAIEEVAMLLGTTTKEVMTKWTILKNQFSREKRKMKGLGGDPNYTTKWFAFKEMEPLMRGTRAVLNISNSEDLDNLREHNSYYKQETRDVSPESGMKSDPSSSYEVHVENMEDEDHDEFERDSITSGPKASSNFRFSSRRSSRRERSNSGRNLDYPDDDWTGMLHRDYIELRREEMRIRVLELRNQKKWQELGSRALDLFERFVDKYCES